MLTKEERAAIVERLRECNDCGFYDIYTAITGEKVPVRTTRDEDFTAISNVILNLCDTSNMVELPLDKDGEIIHVMDTVFNQQGEELVVETITFHHNGINVRARDVDKYNTCVYPPCYLTHKKPVTIKSLVKELTNIAAADYGTPMVVKRKLEKIADKLESLGDSDD